ncbi:hypothetical protein RCL1_008864 [Eukaryota sp. TZLM3-RCL]
MFRFSTLAPLIILLLLVHLSVATKSCGNNCYTHSCSVTAPKPQCGCKFIDNIVYMSECSGKDATHCHQQCFNNHSCEVNGKNVKCSCRPSANDKKQWMAQCDGKDVVKCSQSCFIHSCSVVGANSKCFCAYSPADRNQWMAQCSSKEARSCSLTCFSQSCSIDCKTPKRAQCDCLFSNYKWYPRCRCR